MTPIPKNGLINGKYHLCGVAGRGGWGIIYRAKDMETGTDYALKMSREQLENRGLNALNKELELVQRIHHPSVISYYDFGVYNRRPIIIMELLDLPSLYDYVMRGPKLSEDAKLTIIDHLCEAIIAIHQQGVIHCDLKPQNILIQDDLSIKIVDFGLARELDPNGAVVVNTISGTPHFMATEQLDAPSILSAATDLYALAMITAWLFSEQPSWPRLGIDLLRWRIQNPYALPENISSLSPLVIDVLRSALHHEPQRRVKDPLKFKRGLFRAIRQPFIDPQLLISPTPQEVTLNQSTYEELRLSGLTHQDSMFNTTFLFTEDLNETIDRDHVVVERAQEYSIAVIGVNTEVIERHQRLLYLRDGIIEDLIDLLNVSAKLNLTSFKASQQVTIEPSDLSPHYNWGALSDCAFQCHSELLICLELEERDQGLYLIINAFSITDQLLISRSELTTLYDEILNQLGGLASELGRALKVNLDSPPTDRASIAESIDLLFSARRQATQTWHIDVSEALALYHQALTLSPEDVIILAEMARLEARSSFIGSPPSSSGMSRAVLFAERARQMAPHHPQTLWALGYVRFYQGDHEEALTLLDQAITLGGDRPEVRDLIGRILCEVGPLERALSHLKYALKLDPKQISTRIDLVRLYGYLNQWERVNHLLSYEPQSDSDYGAMEITRARLNLWSSRQEIIRPDRDRDREGSLFNLLIDILNTVYSRAELTDEHHHALSDLITKSASQSRLRVLYYQFFTEIYAYLYDAEHHSVKENIALAQASGLTDQLWLTYCPLLQ